MSGIESGERKATLLSERTHISIRSALAIAIVALIPLTLFLASLSAGQAAANAKMDSGQALTNQKLDSLGATMDLRLTSRDAQLSEITHRVEDHEGRIRTLEARKP